MAAATTERDRNGGPLLPSKGTFPVAANTLIYKGTMVALTNVSGVDHAIAAVDGNGDIVGVAAHTINNLTGSSLGGAAGATDVEVEYGLSSFELSGTAPRAGQKVFALDNQTVTLDDDSGSRGFAGICSEVRTLNGRSLVLVHQNPVTMGLGT